LPEISGKVLQPLHSYAQNLGKVLHTLQNFKPNPGHTFATPAKVSTEFGADNCRGIAFITFEMLASFVNVYLMPDSRCKNIIN
jgi:hypothetical protein